MEIRAKINKWDLIKLRTSLVAQTVKCLPTMWRLGFDPWVGKILWRREWQPTPVLLLGKSHGQWSLVGYIPWGRKESRFSTMKETITKVHRQLSEGEKIIANEATDKALFS